MIVDTSALVAIAQEEPGSDKLLLAILTGALLPAPALIEFERVITRRGTRRVSPAEGFLANLLGQELVLEPFTVEDAALARAANDQHGSGNGRGGTLNLLDLMVYAVARRTGRPILCTGRDFAVTGIPIHPASRLD